MQGRVHSPPKHDDVICSRRSDDNWQALLRYRRAPTQKQRVTCDSPRSTLSTSLRATSGRYVARAAEAMSGETRGLLRDQPPRLHGSMSRTGGGSRDTQISPPPSNQKHGTGKHRDGLTRGCCDGLLILIPLMLACVALVFTARHAANVASRAPTRRLSESHVGGHRTRQRVHLGANLGEASPDSGVAALAGIPDRVTSDLTWARRFALAAELLKVPPAFDLDTLGGQDPNTSQDLAKLRAWTRAHYEPSWTKRHFWCP